MIEIEYGNKYKVSRTTYPTKQIFEDWKKEFFKIEETSDFKIYLVGGFTDIYNDTFDGMDRNKIYTDEELDNMSDKDIVNLEKFLYKTKDIDIAITGPDDPVKIKKLIHEGIRLGYENYGVFIDIMWFKIFEIYDYSENGYSDISEIERYQEKLYLASNTMKINGSTRVMYHRAEQVIDGLWKMDQKFPTIKQVKRIQMGYEFNKPILINSSTEVGSKILDKRMDQLKSNLKNNMDHYPKIWDKNLIDEIGIGLGTNNEFHFAHHDENGNIIAIRTHKGRIIGDGRNKWYLKHLIASYDRNKPIYIAEGEKDTLVLISLGLQSTSGTTGCNSIPENYSDSNEYYDLEWLKDFVEIFICYDADDRGKKGGQKLVVEIIKAYPNLNVKIIQWDKYLDEGFDIFDAFINDPEEGSDFFNACRDAIKVDPTIGQEQQVVGDLTGLEETKVDKDSIPATSLMKPTIYRDKEIYFKSLLYTFEHFITAIKRIDPSVYFWIHGGVFRKVFQNKHIDSDIDIYVPSWEDYDKLKYILMDMGYNNHYISLLTSKFTLFGEININIDLVKPFPIWHHLGPIVTKTDNGREDALNDLYVLHGLSILNPFTTTYWCDLVHASIALDSNFDLFFNKDSFYCIENRILEKQYRDINILKDLIKTEEIITDNSDFNDMILEMISIIDIRHRWSSREKKFISEGYKISDKHQSKTKLDSDFDLFFNEIDLTTLQEFKKYKSLLNDNFDTRYEVRKYFENIFVKNNKIKNEMKKNVNIVNIKDYFMI